MKSPLVGAITAELQDPFWNKSCQRRYARSWGVGPRSNPLARLAGDKCDDGYANERRSDGWLTTDPTVGKTNPRLVLGRMVLLGPGPEYETSRSFEASGRFSSFAAFQLQGRTAWGETAAAKLERTRAKTPVSLLSMTTNATVSVNDLPGAKKIKEKKKKLAEKELQLAALATPIKDPLGPGYYDIDRPVRNEKLSNLVSAGRTKIAKETAKPRTKLNKTDLFEDRLDYRNYDVRLELGKDARAVFITTEPRTTPKPTTSTRIGPGSYDVINALKGASPPSPKAQWLTMATFSKEAHVPSFKNTASWRAL